MPGRKKYFQKRHSWTFLSSSCVLILRKLFCQRKYISKKDILIIQLCYDITMGRVHKKWKSVVFQLLLAPFSASHYKSTLKVVFAREKITFPKKTFLSSSCVMNLRSALIKLFCEIGNNISKKDILVIQLCFGFKVSTIKVVLLERKSYFQKRLLCHPVVL